jgi:hypothetical protein
MDAGHRPSARVRRAAVFLGLLVVGVGIAALYAVHGDATSPGAKAGPGAGKVRRTARRRRVEALIRVPAPHGFPNSRNTGVPAGVRLTRYMGPCTIMADRTVIDRKLIDCDLIIRARDVVISRSKVNGNISSGTDPKAPVSFTVVRSTVDASPHQPREVTAVGEVHFTVIRSDVSGGNRGSNCWYGCKIVYSYFHGQDTDRSGTWHESGIRMGQRAVLRRNTIACDAPDVPPDAGCSAPLTGYGDAGPVRDNLIRGNLFKATPGGTCAYGGSTPDKPYSNRARNIRFIDNVFERGKTGKCGVWFPIADFDPNAPGNVWTGNVWKGGGVVPP